MTPAPSSSPLSVLQITDTHLGAQPGATLLGMDTDDSLQAVLQEIHSEAVTADLLIATGDIALNGAASSYRRFAEYAQPLAPLQSWIAGNHDLATVMDETEAGPRLPARLRSPLCRAHFRRGRSGIQMVVSCRWCRLPARPHSLFPMNT